jgi:hypothetical protein
VRALQPGVISSKVIETVFREVRLEQNSAKEGDRRKDQGKIES